MAAIGLLQEMSLGFNEDDAFFELTAGVADHQATPDPKARTS